MPKVDLKLYSLDSGTGKKITSSVAYVNPATDGATLLEFAQKLNSFTTNVYSSTDRVETTNVDTEPTPVLDKSLRNMSLTGVAQGATATLTMAVAEGETINPVTGYIYGSSSDFQMAYMPATRQQSADPNVGTFTFNIPSYGGGVIFASTFENDAFYSSSVKETV